MIVLLLLWMNLSCQVLSNLSMIDVENSNLHFFIPKFHNNNAKFYYRQSRTRPFTAYNEVMKALYLKKGSNKHIHSVQPTNRTTKLMKAFNYHFHEFTVYTTFLAYSHSLSFDDYLQIASYKCMFALFEKVSIDRLILR